MDITSILVGVSVTLLAFLFDKYLIKIYDYWRKRGIPCVEGALPFFGNSLRFILFRESFDEFFEKVFNANRGRSMVGFFKFRQPSLLLRDPELIKTVMISSFTNFDENVAYVDRALDPLLARNPFFTHGEDWKTERGRLSSALMSAKKLKFLCGSVTNVSSKFAKYLQDNVSKSNGIFEAEAKELFTNFTGEVIASSGFGVEADFFANGTGPDSFRETIVGAYDNNFNIYVTEMSLFLAPIINKILRNSFLPRNVDRFFRRVLHEMIKYRVQNPSAARNDFLQVMLDNQKKEYGKINESGIASSVAALFLDGYHTSSIILSFFAHQVAAHSHVQEKLREEINAVFEKHNGEITYESLVEMTYMDQALNESMRIFPGLTFLMKRCSRACKLVGSDGVECLVEPGTELVVPVRAIHNDPEYWPNPEIYDPERFSNDNKNGRPRCAFVPFGEGPRICVGMRFAMMQIKAAMATTLRSYSIELSPRMKLPVKLQRSAFMSAAEGGLWINFRPL